MRQIHAGNTLVTHYPAQKTVSDRPALVICPGGAYATLSPFEGEPIAQHFAARGFHSFVCHYGVGEQARMPGPLHQLAQSVAIARTYASFVTVCGFSAGGHLCALLSTRWREAANALSLQERAVRPDACVLGYPLTDFALPMPLQPLHMFQSVGGVQGVSAIPDYFRPALCHTSQGDRLDFKAMSLRNLLGTDTPDAIALRAVSPVSLVDQETPPAFVWTTQTDSLVPCKHAIQYSQALHAHGVRTALHIFSQGGHGEGLAENNPESALWPALAENWLLSVSAHP